MPGITIIQLLLVAFVAFALLGTVSRFRRGNLTALQLLIWSFLWVAVGVVAVRPETTSILARYVGVGRGADLIVYLALLGIFYLQFRMFAKLETLEREITNIVRQDAIDKLDKDQNVL